MVPHVKCNLLPGDWLSGRADMAPDISECTCGSQITGSPPLLSDLDILCEMEHEGQCMHFPLSLSLSLSLSLFLSLSTKPKTVKLQIFVHNYFHKLRKVTKTSFY